jgi:hypothetical protein
MKRSRARNSAATDGKLFRAFTALIAASEIGDKLGGYMRERSWGKAALLRQMVKISVGVDDKGWRLLNPLTKKQRAIMDHIGLCAEDLSKYLSG